MTLFLDVAGWAAIVSADSAEPFGAAKAPAAIPDQQRRRLPRFIRDVLQCALPLLHDAPTAPLVFCSPHGDLDSTVKLLTSLAQRELLSPSLFGLSVHNAPAGALSLLIKEPRDQTALAGDAATLAAGLTESYARLATGDAESIVLVHADDRLPPIYAGLEDDHPGVFLAMTLRRANGADDGVEIGAGRRGARDLVRALESGARRLRFVMPRVEAHAA